jgi:S-adenosyl-L-methionine hydrolase (adenosine-forming)
VGKKHEIVSFTSDYGLEDEFVGICHGVMLRIAPHLRIIDLHHGILRHDVRHGAIVLEQAMHFLPPAIHLAVVDPAVGSERRAVVIESGSGQYFVGPDNGVLLPAVAKSGGPVGAWEIIDSEYLLHPISRTFHGRDVFSPVTAHIAGGVDPSELGTELSPDELEVLEVPEAWLHDDHLHAEVLQLDRFGNLQMNFTREQLEKVGLAADESVEIRLEGHRLEVPIGKSFADVGTEEFVFVEDSYQRFSLAVNKGDAAARLQARAGSTIIVGPADH